MARLIVFVALVALGVAGALFLVSGRSAITHAGYRVARLDAERRRLVEANRQLEAQVARLRSPAAVIERVKGLQLDLVPPHESLEERAAKEKAAEPSPRPKRTR